MQEVQNKNTPFARIEFWAATTIFVFLIFFHISDAMTEDWTGRRSPSRAIPFEFYFFPTLARYAVLYLAFLVLNFKIVPALLSKRDLLKNISLLIFCYLVISLAMGVTATYLKSYLFSNFSSVQEAHNYLYQNAFLFGAWLLLLFGFYSIIKYVGVYLLAHADQIEAKYPYINRNVVGAFVIWMITLFVLIAAGAEKGIILPWAIVVPFGIFIYSIATRVLIPRALPRRRSFLYYLGMVALLLFVTYFPVSVLLILFTEDEDPAFIIAFFNALLQLFITAPLSWVLFKRRLKGAEEIYVLRKELRRSHANFDFLRSQINPHFLFNALNTIYGTALQEGAERTGEGVQKLGDMMRFMLQENMQDKIPLSREIEYLNNYISLQKLRTDPNPGIRIDADIEEPLRPVELAPMLLIPFVENAFKHGISFRQDSFIRVSLQSRNGVLEFDVNNSKHERTENDPEKDRSGIGLANVKQRLQLLYPAKHELVIRETSKEFFVHLTIRLT